MKTTRTTATSALGGLVLATASACNTDVPAPERTGATEGAFTTGTTLVGAQSHRCLDVAAASTVAGAALQIFECHGKDNQIFTFAAGGDVRVFGDTRCLAPEVEPAAASTRVVSALCTNAAAQKWAQGTDGTVVHQASGLCLDVKDAGTNDRAAVQLYPCNGGANQQWHPDTQPPTPPTDPATSDVTCNTATFAWGASTDDVGVLFYDVFHDGQLIKSIDGRALSTSITVVPNASWGLYVNARDAAGNVSQASATVVINPPPCQVDTQPPSTPTGLTGSSSGTSVTLQWTASTDDVGVAAYEVYRNDVRVGTVVRTPAGSTPTTFVDSGLSPSTSYGYSVVARDAQGNVSPSSAPITVRTGAACSTAVCSVTQVGTDTDVPWGLLSLPDGTVLYSRRDARDIVRLDPTTGRTTRVATIPNVAGTDGEGGLMGLAVGPGFPTDPWLYVMHTSPTDNRIVRFRYQDGTLDLASEQVLLTGILRNKYHNGGRLRVGPDGKLYASTGDAQNGANAQKVNGLNGKVLRLNVDGSVPTDNPFGNYVWSYGHRNPQGLAFDAQGRLWEQEFGNSTMDETNLVQRGGNYGWPDCEGTVSQSGKGCATAGFLAPKLTYSTAEGSCSGIAIVRDALYVACQRGTRLYRAAIVGSSLTNVQQFFVGTYGRLRTVEPTIDGNLWLTTTNSGDKDSTPNNSNEKVLKVLLGL